MIYDFDKPVNRRNTNCYKYDSDIAKGKLPLWVADMDFEAAAPIRDALQKRLNHGVFGYTVVPDSYFESLHDWFAVRHNWNTLTRAQSIYTIGVVPAISAILQALCPIDARVLILAPNYNCFYSSIRNSRCILVESELRNIDNHYEIDWKDVEEKMQNVNLFLLCNPHNPVGRIWTREELTHLASLAEAHHVFVVSDEIHCEFTFAGYHYTPYATVAKTDNYAVCTAASKAFNIAGLQFANIFVPNDVLRVRIDKQININEVCDVNPFGFVATEAAYRECGDWIDQLNVYIESNYRFFCDYIARNLPQLQVTRMEGTYLTWVNCSALFHDTIQDSTALEADISGCVGLLINAGEMYGASGHDYMRINLACQKSTLAQALELLSEYADMVHP